MSPCVCAQGPWGPGLGGQAQVRTSTSFPTALVGLAEATRRPWSRISLGVWECWPLQMGLKTLSQTRHRPESPGHRPCWTGSTCLPWTRTSARGVAPCATPGAVAAGREIWPQPGQREALSGSARKVSHAADDAEGWGGPGVHGRGPSTCQAAHESLQAAVQYLVPVPPWEEPWSWSDPHGRPQSKRPHLPLKREH